MKFHVNAFTLLVAAGATLVGARAEAVDFSVLGGYQINNDAEVAPVDSQPEAPSLTLGAPGDSVEIEDGFAGSVAVDFVFQGDATKRVGIWASHQRTDFEDNSGLVDTNLSITHVHFTGMSYYPSGNLEPFVLAGFGATIFDPDDSSLKSATGFSLQIGAGTNYRFTENLLLRADVRWIPSFFQGSSSALCSSGCAIQLSSDVYHQVQASVGIMLRF